MIGLVSGLMIVQEVVGDRMTGGQRIGHWINCFALLRINWIALGHRENLVWGYYNRSIHIIQPKVRMRVLHPKSVKK